MSKIEKLKIRIKSRPKDFHFDELIVLLLEYGYKFSKAGKTAGSRVKFENKLGDKIFLHKPHPSGILKEYQIKQIIQKLEL